jgi:hypothetical integral membrane protein (TIGR02206 family)
MKPWHKVLVAVGFSVLFGMEIVMCIVLARPAGIRVHAPLRGTALPRETTVVGDAWAKGGLAGISVRVRGTDGASWSVPAERDTIRYRGRAVSVLAGWHARVTFPAEGTYTLTAVAVTADGGRTLETAARAVTVSPAAASRQFVFASPPHLAALGVILIACILVPLLVRRSGSALVRDRVGLVIVLVLYAHELAYQVYWFAIGAWTIGNCLLFHMCGLALMFMPLVFFSPEGRFRQYLFEVLYFFGLGGAMQALFTPDIGMHGFPEPKYWSYFLSHGTIVMGLVYAAVAYRLRIGWRGVLRMSAVSLCCAMAAWGFNQLFLLVPPYELGNYFIMGYPPPTGSVIDLFAAVFGPAPRYLAGLVLMGAVVIALITTPYWVGWLARGRRRAVAVRG